VAFQRASIGAAYERSLKIYGLSWIDAASDGDPFWHKAGLVAVIVRGDLVGPK